MTLLTLCKEFMSETDGLVDRKSTLDHKAEILNKIVNTSKYVMLMELLTQFETKPLFESMTSTILKIRRKLQSFIERYDETPEQIMFNYVYQLKILGYE